MYKKNYYQYKPIGVLIVFFLNKFLQSTLKKEKFVV